MDADVEDSHKKGRHRKKQLYNSILHQMEFYFSDSNLAKDRYLAQLMQNDPYVDISEFIKFNKIRKLTTSIEDIQKALAKSEIVQLSDDKTKVCRKTPVKTKDNVDECTIYVERLKSDTTHEFLTNIFSDFGHVEYVSIPKYKHNKVNKGFAFVEFENANIVQNVLAYFESIGCKMSSNTDPQELCSITSFQKENNETCETENSKNEESIADDAKSESRKNKRKLSEEGTAPNSKKVKVETEIEAHGDASITEEHEIKKKKKKEHKRKNQIIELGLQVLSKQEWKKLRNKYLDLQRKKMKEFKMHLHRAKYSQNNYKENDNKTTSNKKSDENSEKEPVKLVYTPGVIVKIQLSEPCLDDKKIKNEIKSLSPNIKYVEIPLSSGNGEIFVRFADNKSAKDFCNSDFKGQKLLLENDEEKSYWERIQEDRSKKFNKEKKKQRGKDKLLKKAAKELGKHIHFDDDNN